jgi:HpcH/HpaI aldolase/citrate lyase family
MSARPLHIMLFEHEAENIHIAATAGVDSFIVDWEWRGKEHRQAGFDTEVNHLGLVELKAAVGASRNDVWCRINPWHSDSRSEIDQAIEAGAVGIFLPMVRHVDEVDAFLAATGNRARVGIVVETLAAVNAARELAERPLDAAYVGLNDWMIDRRGQNLFEPIASGELERLRASFARIPFGFGGITVVSGGDPVPSRLLLAEMARLDASFVFARRSFKRDARTTGVAEIVRGVRALWREHQSRPPARIEEDARELRRVIAQLR